MNPKQKHIIFLEQSGFPYGLASMEKLKLLSKSLILANVRVLVSNRKPALKRTTPDLPSNGRYEGIDYIYTAKPPYKGQRFIPKIFSNLIGLFGELFLFISLKRKHQLDGAIVSSTHFILILYYRLVSKLLNFPLVLNIAELHIAVPSGSVYRNISNRLFDRYSFGLVDGVIAISKVLEDRVIQFYPDKPVLRIPVLCDFNLFNKEKDANSEKYFLFCSGAGYFELIQFIIGSFEKLGNTNNVCLYLVVSGKKSQMDKVSDLIQASSYSEKIKIFSDISYNELTDLYINALALLIPIRNNLRDAARFPHKIGEYLASKNPIITTNFGEIQYFFQDNKNALISALYDEGAFSEKMREVLQNESKSRKIGLNGYNTGVKHFHYENYSLALRSFLFKE